MPAQADALAVEQLLGFKIPSADEVYDVIMRKIEPDLVTATIPLLPEKYKGESEEDRKARFRRYDEAFKEYEKQFNEWIENIKKKYEEARKKMRVIAEKKTQEKEAVALEALESSFDSV